MHKTAIQKLNKLYRIGLEEISDKDYDIISSVSEDKPRSRSNKTYTIESCMSLLGLSTNKITDNIAIKPKIDGCNITLRYNQSTRLLSSILTRTGRSLTDKHIKMLLEETNIPLYSSEPEVEGELYLENKNYSPFSARYFSPRSVVAGWMNKKIPFNIPLRFFDFRSSEFNLYPLYLNTGLKETTRLSLPHINCDGLAFYNNNNSLIGYFKW